MQPKRNSSDRYKRHRLWAASALAVPLSLAASLLMYYGAEASVPPLWLRAWMVSLSFMALTVPLISFAEGRGLSAAASFVAAAVAMAAASYAVYGYWVAREAVAWRRILAGQIVCTVPYLASCAASVALSCLAPTHKRDNAEHSRYTSQRMDFLSEHGKVELSITSDRLLYMESHSNYLTVTYLDTAVRGGVATMRIRSSLKSAEARFGRFPIVRANRSCIVNGERIDYLVRKGRGGMLKLHGCDYMIGISHQNYDTLSKYAERESRAGY